VRAPRLRHVCAGVGHSPTGPHARCAAGPLLRHRAAVRLGPLSGRVWVGERCAVRRARSWRRSPRPKLTSRPPCRPRGFSSSFSVPRTPPGVRTALWPPAPRQSAQANGQLPPRRIRGDVGRPCHCVTRRVQGRGPPVRRCPVWALARRHGPAALTAQSSSPPCHRLPAQASRQVSRPTVVCCLGLRSGVRPSSRCAAIADDERRGPCVNR